MNTLSQLSSPPETASALLSDEHVDLPEISSWRNWNIDDYRSYFLSKAAAVARLRKHDRLLDTLSPTELTSFLEPIREIVKEKYSAQDPSLSIVLRAHNEEREIIPTLVSYAMTRVPSEGAELIVVDNASSDRTNAIIHAAGARCVECPRKGIGYATRAGYESSAPSAEYVFISDADVRMTKPFSDSDSFREGSVLETSSSFLENHPEAMGVSTGMVFDATHWSHELFRQMNARLRNKQAVSYWSGPNQFFRKSALEAVGGINERVEYGYGEDFYRLYTVARYAKPLGYMLESGRTVEELRDPVYQSGRRCATLSLTVRHLLRTVMSKKRPLGEDGMPVFQENGAVTKPEVRL